MDMKDRQIDAVLEQLGLWHSRSILLVAVNEPRNSFPTNVR